ncbi:uncharacterized protein LOC134528847 [Bacillus rossius redtenbacheri]|uniref:uncharacterized protein LOC134528847 n=1 Tax=Bacillus rossius redtenbacheri TaxID=93214 RepID=UPI002FDE26F2
MEKDDPQKALRELHVVVIKQKRDVKDPDPGTAEDVTTAAETATVPKDPELPSTSEGISDTPTSQKEEVKSPEAQFEEDMLEAFHLLQLLGPEFWELAVAETKEGVAAVTGVAAKIKADKWTQTEWAYPGPSKVQNKKDEPQQALRELKESEARLPDEHQDPDVGGVAVGGTSAAPAAAEIQRPSASEPNDSGLVVQENTVAAQNGKGKTSSEEIKSDEKNKKPDAEVEAQDAAKDVSGESAEGGKDSSSISEVKTSSSKTSNELKESETRLPEEQQEPAVGGVAVGGTSAAPAAAEIQLPSSVGGNDSSSSSDVKTSSSHSSNELKESEARLPDEHQDPDVGGVAVGGTSAAPAAAEIQRPSSEGGSDSSLNSEEKVSSSHPTNVLKESEARLPEEHQDPDVDGVAVGGTSAAPAAAEIQRPSSEGGSDSSLNSEEKVSSSHPSNVLKESEARMPEEHQDPDVGGDAVGGTSAAPAAAEIQRPSSEGGSDSSLNSEEKVSSSHPSNVYGETSSSEENECEICGMRRDEEVEANVIQPHYPSAYEVPYLSDCTSTTEENPYLLPDEINLPSTSNQRRGQRRSHANVVGKIKIFDNESTASTDDLDNWSSTTEENADLYIISRQNEETSSSEGTVCESVMNIREEEIKNNMAGPDGTSSKVKEESTGSSPKMEKGKSSLPSSKSSSNLVLEWTDSDQEKGDSKEDDSLSSNAVYSNKSSENKYDGTSRPSSESSSNLVLKWTDSDQEKGDSKEDDSPSSHAVYSNKSSEKKDDGTSRPSSESSSNLVLKWTDSDQEKGDSKEDDSSSSPLEERNGSSSKIKDGNSSISLPSSRVKETSSSEVIDLDEGNKKLDGEKTQVGGADKSSSKASEEDKINLMKEQEDAAILQTQVQETGKSKSTGTECDDDTKKCNAEVENILAEAEIVKGLMETFKEMKGSEEESTPIPEEGARVFRPIDKPEPLKTVGGNQDWSVLAPVAIAAAQAPEASTSTFFSSLTVHSPFSSFCSSSFTR